MRVKKTKEPLQNLWLSRRRRRADREKNLQDRRLPKSIIIRIGHDLKPRGTAIVLMLIANMASAPLALLQPIPLKIGIDQVLQDKPIMYPISLLVPPELQESTSGLAVWCAALVVIIAVANKAQEILSAFLSTFVSYRLLADMRLKLFQHAQSLCFRYHDSVGAADSLYRINNDSYSLGNIAAWGISPLLTSALTTGMIFLVLARTSGTLAIVAIVIAPLLFIISAFYSTRIRSRWHKAQGLDSKALSIAHESLNSLRLIKSFNQERLWEDKFQTSIQDSITARAKYAVIEGSYNLLTGLLLAGGTALVLYIGINQVLSGIMSTGQLVVVMAYLAQLYWPMKSLGDSILGLQSGIAEMERCYNLLDQVPSVIEHIHPVHIVHANGNIKIDCVSFGYSSRKEILSDVSLDIPAGSSLGILGKTGSGKSTLMGLIARFYDPSRGRILLDGIDISEMRLEDLRRQFALVLQEPILFSGTIAENISLGYPGASFHQIKQAAIAAYADEFIEKLPNGYDTNLGEKGMTLSGGERQRLSIARAVIKNAPILLLDEPTSAVDSQSEKIIMSALTEIIKGRTTIMIAHRLDTLSNCDSLVEVRDGTVQFVDKQDIWPDR